MQFRGARREEPADARDALLKRCFAKDLKNTMYTSISMPLAADLKLLNHSGQYSGRSSRPQYSHSNFNFKIYLTPSSSSAYSTPSLGVSPNTSLSVSPITPDDDDYANSGVFPEDEENLDDDVHVREHHRFNRERVELIRQCQLIGEAAPQICTGFRPRPRSDEQEIENILLRWEHESHYVPDNAVCEALTAFACGTTLQEMSSANCAALIQCLFQAMLKGKISHNCAGKHEIENFLFQESSKLGTAGSSGNLKKHWVCGTLQDRTYEVGWLRVQAEKRFWRCNNNHVYADCERSRQLSENATYEGLYNTYIQEPSVNNSYYSGRYSKTV